MGNRGTFVLGSGPKVHLTTRQMQNFSMAVHELATNAVKYGALRNGSGALAVSWVVTLDNKGGRQLGLS
jgi:two-component sensor histidine kinase